MENDFQPPRNVALLAAVFEGGLVVVAIGLGWLVGQAPLETFRWAWTDAALAAAATLPLLLLLWLCLRCPIRPFRQLVRVVDELLVPMFRGCRLLELAVVSLLAGVGEEMLFRGVIQAEIADWVGPGAGQWVALAVAAVLFGLAHAITLTYALLTGLVGLYLGWLWIETGNLLVPIFVHATYDFIALTYLVKFRQPPARKTSTTTSAI